MNIAVIVGTRPEFIKMSPVIKECSRRGMGHFILHTGQHYSSYMDKLFFEQLDLPNPKYNLGIGSGSHGETTGRMLIGIEKILLEEKTDIIFVQGDTNTVLAGALAACKLGVKIGHIEAGLRSYDRTMPEEVNRVLTDHVSDYLFAPTEISKSNLIKEGLSVFKISVTGNTIVDMIYQNYKIAEKSNILNKIGINKRKYFLVTVHRQENVDVEVNMTKILAGLKMIAEKYEEPIIFPIHPRTSRRIKEFGLSISEQIRLIEPVGFLDFLQLEANARLILTDSGGVQEESCVLNVPCVTLRKNTERPETLIAGSNILAGVEPGDVLRCVSSMLESTRSWTNPFGDGKASMRIIENLIKGN